MAQTESMVRLLKDGKVVGYITIEPNHIYFMNPGGNQWEWKCMDETQFDSFDPGVKVGENWFFEGDILKHITYRGTASLEQAGSGLWRLYPIGPAIRIPIPFIERAEEYRVVGNIHEEEKP
jgi:hypothetical protein